MPAVTVADITALPHIPQPDPAASTFRPVISVNTAPRGFEGEGFPVHRAFAGTDPSLIDPFIHMDQMGEVEYAPGEPKGTPWHPHRGFETVTYMIDGTFQHQDFQRRRRPHHQRRHAVDDRRRGHPAHRASTRGVDREWRSVPRLPALGQPPRGAEVGSRALPGHSRRQRRAAQRRTTVARCCASSPARSRVTRDRASPTHRSRSRT